MIDTTENEEDKGDEVLRRMLKTPPDPKTPPKPKPGKDAGKADDQRHG